MPNILLKFWPSECDVAPCGATHEVSERDREGERDKKEEEEKEE
jgi:hypothetical protein